MIAQLHKPSSLFIIICLFLIGISALTAFATDYGDVNSSGQVDIIDALLTAQYAAGFSSSVFDTSKADVNGDKTVSIVDALLIARYAGGIINYFPLSTPSPTPIRTPTPTCEKCTRYVSGTVTNAAGQPIVNASISEITTLITTTDATGRFVYAKPATKPYLNICPTGDTYLVVEAPGYQKMSRFITADCGTYTYHFTLAPQFPPTPTPVGNR